MSDKERIVELEKDLHRFKLALQNAKAIEQTYLKFGPIFDELFEKIGVVEKKITQLDVEVKHNKLMIVKALQEKYRGGTS